MKFETTNLLTRDEVVQQEGHLAGEVGQTQRDNPYRPGSADWQSWNSGFAKELAAEAATRVQAA